MMEGKKKKIIIICCFSCEEAKGFEEDELGHLVWLYVSDMRILWMLGAWTFLSQ